MLTVTRSMVSGPCIQIGSTGSGLAFRRFHSSFPILPSSSAGSGLASSHPFGTRDAQTVPEALRAAREGGSSYAPGNAEHGVRPLRSTSAKRTGSGLCVVHAEDGVRSCIQAFSLLLLPQSAFLLSRVRPCILAFFRIFAEIAFFPRGAPPFLNRVRSCICASLRDARRTDLTLSASSRPRRRFFVCSR